MAGRDILQMHQTTPADQGVLWNDPERGGDAGVDGHRNLLPVGDRPQAFCPRTRYASDRANFEVALIRKNACFLAVFEDPAENR